MANIDSPLATSYCIEETGSVPVNGTCGSNTTCLWFKFLGPGEDCGTFTENPIQCGASQFLPDSSGNWSAGSVGPGSSSGYGDRCLIIWSLDNNSSSISATTRSFTFLQMGDPLCGSSGSGSGGGSGSGSGAGSASGTGTGIEMAMPWERGLKRERGKRRGGDKQRGVRQAFVAAGGPRRPDQRVIRDKAPLTYRVVTPADKRWSGVRLEFDAARSSQRRARWRSTDKSGSWALDIRRGASGTLEATLTYFRFGRRSVRGPFVWTGAWCFRKDSVELRGQGLPDVIVEAG